MSHLQLALLVTLLLPASAFAQRAVSPDLRELEVLHLGQADSSAIVSRFGAPDSVKAAFSLVRTAGL